MPSLIYIADPMCTWCYGFAPELVTLLQGLPDLPVEIIAGGLRAYNKQPLEDNLCATMQDHCDRVANACAMPFAATPVLQPGMVYDTEPACRALVTARVMAPEASFAVLHAMQHAFFAEGRDVGDGNVLADVCARAMAESGFPVAPEAFKDKWMSREMVLATAEDFGQTRRWGVNGFPTLILERNGRLDLVTAGYVGTEQLIEQMQAVIDGETVPA